MQRRGGSPGLGLGFSPPAVSPRKAKLGVRRLGSNRCHRFLGLGVSFVSRGHRRRYYSLGRANIELLTTLYLRFASGNSATAAASDESVCSYESIC
ncbi:unnamed protein product [Soboliphyme baturini]|uniref:Uncharacterized protein n=1 Tax=Soboliphyme baturini TaxID=241478 RepID=A0A183J5R9_9BILA|nr:unnamed protein product [Soboliphyme baturini]